MKKIFVIFIVLLISFSLFAYESRNGYVHINGFFEESETSLIFKVWKENFSSESERIYHSGDIFLDVNPIENEVTIFNWEVSGNKTLNINLTFTITPLQAFMGGTYYIPKHTLKMYDGVLTKTHNFSTATTGSSSYPGYRQSSSGSGVFIINSAVFSYDETISDVITKSGYCTLQILSYDESTAGDFDYVSYVTVEFDIV